MTFKQEIKLQEALAAAYREHEAWLYKRAFFKVNDHSLSQDLVQNTFLKAWSYMQRGGKIDFMKAFLSHVLNNLIIDQYRKHKTASLDLLLEKGFEPQDLNRARDDERMIDVLDGRAALSLISQIPKKYQKVIDMRYREDMSLEEMSQATGLSKNTIAVQSYRGLLKLRELCNQ